ncbi:MAG TPA: D-alanyl-D-alanine carboxypeptidase [Capillimicrobium sp.]
MFPTTALRALAPLIAGAAVAASAAPAMGEPKPLPAAIERIMDKPRYADASWSLLVSDVRSGATHFALRPERLALTGSTRKLFSVGTALDTLGAGHRELTTVHRSGRDLVLRAAGDLTFGGRRVDADTVAVTDFDHNDANGLGTAILTPQDPLFALDALARQVREAGITEVPGDVVVDDRLFVPYRVPNGNLLVSPMLVNENMVDVEARPTAPGQPAAVTVRPATAAFAVTGAVATAPAGENASVELSDRGLAACIGQRGCAGTVSGSLPVGYRAPLSGRPTFVGTFRVEEPAAFARTAFIEALGRAGVRVAAAPVGPNPRALLPRRSAVVGQPRVAVYRSAPYAQVARLVLKVSLNLGANLSLSLLGLDHGQRTVEGALAAERRALVRRFGIDGRQFDFPTNGSGTPDSRATPRAIVDLLRAMTRTRVAEPFAAGLPVMGVDGSLATVGTDLPARGHVRAKTGTTIAAGADGETMQLKAQNLAGYITTRSGRRVAYALMVNDAGPVSEIETDVAAVLADEAAISNAIYEAL